MQEVPARVSLEALDMVDSGCLKVGSGGFDLILAWHVPRDGLSLKAQKCQFCSSLINHFYLHHPTIMVR